MRLSFVLNCILFVGLLVHAASLDVGYSAEDLVSEDTIHALFQRWGVEHGKFYHSQAERESRFATFKHKLLEIHAHNTQPSISYWMGLNAFSDVTTEELNAGMFESKVRRQASAPKLSQKRLRETPSSVDWRDQGAVSPVKNVITRNCSGGTWAVATAGAVEGINHIATGELLELSTQQLLDCETFGNQKCKSGFPQNGLEYLVEEAAGLMTEAEYPFTGKNETCQKKSGYIVGIDGYDRVYGSSDDTELQEMVAQQPVTALVDAKTSEFQNYKGGIFKGPCSEDTISLSVLIVGYGSDNGQKYWILKNSWGTSWGENGYMKLERGASGLPLGRCAINSFPWYPTKAKLPLSSRLQRDLVGYWKLDDKTGSTAKDSSPTNATCTLLTGATWGSDGGLAFNGAGKVLCRDKPSLCGKTAFSLSAWVKVPTTATAKGIIIQQRSASDWSGTWTTLGYNGEYQFYLAQGGKPSFWVWGEGRDQFRISSSVSVNDNKWHHLVAVRDVDKASVYVDGSVVATVQTSPRNLSPNLPVYIGCDCRDNVDFFVGSIKGVSINKRALTVDEIKQLTATGPVGYDEVSLATE